MPGLLWFVPAVAILVGATGCLHDAIQSCKSTHNQFSQLGIVDRRRANRKLRFVPPTESLCRSVFFRFCRIFEYVPKIDIVWLCPKTCPDFSARQDLYNRWIQVH